MRTANEQAAKIIETAKETARQEKESAMQGAKTEIDQLAMAAATKLLMNGSSTTGNQMLYDEFLQKQVMQMTQTAINYARVLYELSVSPERIQEAEKIITETPQLLHTLESPVVPLSQRKGNWANLCKRPEKFYVCALQIQSYGTFA